MATAKKKTDEQRLQNIREMMDEVATEVRAHREDYRHTMAASKVANWMVRDRMQQLAEQKYYDKVR